MFHEITVPLDGSAHSEHALALAAAIADVAGARLTLVRVHTPLGRVTAVSGASMLEVDEYAIDRAQRYLDGLARDMAPELNGDRLATRVLVGGVSAELLRYTRESGSDLVVMTTHGRGAVGRAWLGSVADRMVRRARVPILLLRPGERSPALPASAPAWLHVLVTLDGSDIAAQVLGSALALAKLMHARITLLRVVERTQLEFGYPSVPHGVVLEPRGLEDEVQEARAYVDGVADELHAAGAEVNAMVVVHPRPAEAILETADAIGADLIALSTRGHGGLSRVFLGSVADKVLRGASVPVLLQRPQAGRPEARVPEAAAAALGR